MIRAIKSNARRFRVAADEENKNLEGLDAVIERSGSPPNLTLLEITMETGVTHQIRVHLAAIGHPIVADALYGDDRMDKSRFAAPFFTRLPVGVSPPRRWSSRQARNKIAR